MRFEVPTVVNIQIMVFLDVIPFSVVDGAFTNTLEAAVSSNFMKMKATGSCKMLVLVYQTHHIPHNCDLNMFTTAGTY
jgi:hypothetical protein